MDIAAELAWLQANPHFWQRPASIREFCGSDYLNIIDRIRPSIMDGLEEMFGDEVSGERISKYPLAMWTGGIGIGKTTVASICLPYMAHWVLCLRDPQGFFKLLPGSRIAFMQMSTSGAQAKEVVFGDIKARIEYSPWFIQNFPYDPNFKNQIRFPKDIWILPGDSAETTFEGYNILGGILDEADSHKITKTKDYAEQGYTTISTRIASRFGDQGILLVVGQMKRANGFAARKYDEFRKNPKAYTKRMAIWESFGWDKYLRPDGTRDSFWYDTRRHEIMPQNIGDFIKDKAQHLIEIPNLYKQEFLNNPQKALRDLAGYPPATGSPFITLTHKLEEARNRWIERYNNNEYGDKLLSPIAPHGDGLPRLEPWFKSPDTLKRVGHLDMAYSAEGDSLGFAMGHVNSMVEIDGERKPYIIIDLLMRVHAPAGREIFLGDIRRFIYHLKNERGFKVHKVTIDGFQSTDTRQQLERNRIYSDVVSVDKTILPYHDLREAIYENRIEWPQYLVKLRQDDTEFTEIAYKELSELTDDGMKVDHNEEGSKDVADAMAGVVYNLMGDRTYHRKNNHPIEYENDLQPVVGHNGLPSHPAVLGEPMHSAPLPPLHGTDGLWRPRRRT